jgi:ribonuclease T2
MRNILAFLAMAFASSAGLAQASPDLGPKTPGNFDYYVLALTWVPAFCATNSDPQECGKNMGFALHGLWPQYASGDYPSNCAQVALTPAARDTFETIYASPKMIEHEWSKHGTCSGLAPADYFTLSKADAAFVVVPPAYRTETALPATDSRVIAQAFIAANPGLVAEDFTVIARNGMVSEIRFCIAKVTAFRSCSAK